LVNAGTNGGTAWTRPSSVPASSSTLLVTQYRYNSAGLLNQVIDPLGIDTLIDYDSLGRVIQTFQDYTDGTETTESNIRSNYNYDGNNNVKNGKGKTEKGTSCRENGKGDIVQNGKGDIAKRKRGHRELQGRKRGRKRGQRELAT
jgi:YD repeat-containing protein